MTTVSLVALVFAAVCCLSAGANQCCSYPCLNGGICITDGSSAYKCDCTGLDYSGPNCEHPTLWKWLTEQIRPEKEILQYVVTHYPWLWWVINKVPFLHSFIVKGIYLQRGSLIDSPHRYNSLHEYITLDTYYNRSLYARTLPPVPVSCPTPTGTAGKKSLPDIDALVKKFFVREKFLADPHGSNLLFAYYAQHFTHQFFKTNTDAGAAFTLGDEGVDVSHIYGKELSTENRLRSWKNGRLKSQIINDEEFPPFLKDVAVPMSYPPHVPEHGRFALGQPFYGLLPGLFVYNTIWLREHNRVSGILHSIHPEWDDEQLFQTSKLIILGETIKITIEDYVQHLSRYHLQLTFDPELIHGSEFQYANRIRVEFNHLYHWHPLFPDGLKVGSDYYTVKQMMYNVTPVFQHGFTAYIDAMIKEPAGALTHHNHAPLLLPVLKNAIQHGRDLRLQSFNQYRRRFHLKPYTTFLELTGDETMATELENLYGSIEALEFYPGLLLEKPGYSVTPPSMVEIGGPYSVKGLLANPICSPLYWKPSTFGGDVGFELVRNATLQQLFCNNLKGPCPRIAFSVEQDQTSASKEEL